MEEVPLQPIDVSLATSRGVVVHQRFENEDQQPLPYAPQVTYRVSRLPEDKLVRSDVSDAGWTPTSAEIDKLDKFLLLREESSLGLHILLALFGCHTLWPLTLHFVLDGTSNDVFVARRPFQMSGFYGCPMRMDVDAVRGSELVRIGCAREYFSPYGAKCYVLCCLCTTYTDIDRCDGDAIATRYTVRTNLCCCGRVNNCCGGTPGKRDAIYDILAAGGNTVSHLHLVGGEWSRAFVLEFPPDSTAEDRVVTALFQIQTAFFEPGPT
ncbi:hypothetical protein SDRG_16372 [Saprolegnia diclina VS20]|uniref:Phospholipid scramblase n=1 Tax=Saprolegnia diclina (strain VS20) TaxID=1156394 RepID=T0PU48_SAPDV|nr:hypothetical protein SDRG_16372 [Saprolegnia diclina VS20]EQC25776.1 hypothetical protein SDRG_16372 [Saprolegnia diclina VS20]|eukprot:XP_008620801.1 hypothetical protein SDRG_16372 [Saprolegnia diclina VS20]